MVEVPPSAAPQLGSCASSGRAATASGARASRLQSRRFHCFWPCRRCAITTGYWTRAGLITYTLPYGQHPRTLYKYELSLVADREGRAFAKRDQVSK